MPLPAGELMGHPAASDGTADSLSDAKIRAGRALLEEVTAAGLRAVGVLSWYDWPPGDVPAALDFLATTEPRIAQLRPWFDNHPLGHLVLAVVVTEPR